MAQQSTSNDERFWCSRCGELTTGTISAHGVHTSLCAACFREKYPPGSPEPRYVTWVDWLKRAAAYGILAFVAIATGLLSIELLALVRLWTGLNRWIATALTIALWILLRSRAFRWKALDHLVEPWGRRWG